MGLPMEKLPDWPRMLKRATAAAYLDISVAEFEREIMGGRIPSPVSLGNGPHWSRVELDAYMDRLSGGPADDWRSRTNLYASR